MGGDKAEHGTHTILWKDSGAWTWTQPAAGALLHKVARQDPGQPWHLHCQFGAQRAAAGCEHSPDAHKGAAAKGWGSSRMRPLLSQGKPWPRVHTSHPTGSARPRPRCVIHVCPLLGYAQNSCHRRSRGMGGQALTGTRPQGVGSLPVTLLFTHPRSPAPCVPHPWYLRAAPGIRRSDLSSPSFLL